MTSGVTEFGQEGSVRVFEDGSQVSGAEEITVLNFTGAPGVTVTGTNRINVPLTPGAAITASNKGAGVGVFDGKVGSDFEFRSLVAASTKISISLDGANKEIDIDVVESNISHTAIADIGSNSHAAIDTHLASTSNPHSTSIANIDSGTLAQLNTAVSDATLIDTADARLSDDRTADGLRTATTIVSISASAAPSAGEVLKATSSTVAEWATEAGGVADLDDAYDGGATITQDAGPIILNVSTTSGGALDINVTGPLTETVAQIDIDFATGNWTGTPHGISVSYASVTSLSNASDIHAIELVGATNAGGGDSVGVSIDAGFDQGIENASTLVQTALATFSGGLTNSAGEVLISGGNLQFADSIESSWGTNDDFTISYDNTGDDLNLVAGANLTQIDWDLTPATNAVYTIRLDTNVAALFEVLNAAATRLFSVGGDGAIDADGGTLTVPSGSSFLIGGVALTTAAFTSANVDTLLDGSNADALHTHAGLGANTLDAAYDEGGAGAGRTITVDSGAIVLNVSTTSGGALDINASGPLTETTAQVDVDFGAGNWTGTPHGLSVSYGSVTSLSNASDIHAVELFGATNAGSGDSVGVSIDSGFDQGIENASTLVQTALATFSGGVTNSSGEVLLSGGNLQLNDSINLTLGSADELKIVHTGSAGAGSITNTIGALTIENTDTDDAIIVKLGTTTTATSFQIQDSAAAVLLNVLGAGDLQFAASSGTSGQVLTSNGAAAGPTWQAAAGGNALDDAYDQGGAGAGRTITVDSGPVALIVSTTSGGALDINADGPLTETVAQVDIDFAASAWTGTNHGLSISYGAVVSLTNASDIHAIELFGATNAGSGDSVGLSVDSAFDQGIENASSLVQTALATFSGGVTNSAGEVLLSGGNLQLNDALNLTLGSADELTLVHTGSAGAGSLTNTVGSFTIENSDSDDAIIVKLGTATTATKLEVQTSAAGALFAVLGAGDVQVGGDSGTSGQVLTSGGAAAAPSWAAAPAGLTPLTGAAKTAGFTASAGDFVRYDPSAGTFTLIAPASPSNGDRWAVKNVTADTTAITVDGNSNDIENPNGPFNITSFTSFDIGVEGLAIEWVFSSADTAWLVA